MDSRVERHGGDVVRIVLGLVVVGITCLLALQDPLSDVERNWFHLFNGLPRALHSFFATVQQAGAFPAVIVVTAAALVVRRFRLALAFAIAGTAAWFGAKVLKVVIDRPRPFNLFDTIVRGAPAEGLGFPSGHSAVSAALATVLAPYLPRWGRRAAWGLVLLVGIARMYVGAHLPLDVLGGWALGWAAGSAANLAVGSPARRPSVDALRRLFAAHAIDVVSVQVTGPQSYIVDTGADRRLVTRVVSNDERDADALFKAWRHISYRGVEDDAPFLSSRRIVEHEAFLSLLATRERVSTPRVVLAGPVSDGMAALAEELVEGTPIRDLGPAALTDDTLERLWREVAKLRAARIAHRDLRLANLIVDGEGGAWIVDFGAAESEASDRALARDVAELLAGLATVAGVERSVRAAVDVLGAEALTAALPLLQPLALSRATRQACRQQDHLLARLRDEAAKATGVDVPELETLPRIRPRTLAYLAVVGVALYVLIPQFGELDKAWNVILDADWPWLLAAVLASALTYAAAALQLQGAVPDRLNPVHTVENALAGSFANRITPAGVGGVATSVRYLQRCGFGLPEAGSFVALSSAMGFLVHMLGLVVTGLLVGSRADSITLPPVWAIVAGAALLVLAGGAAIAVPAVRRAVRPQVEKVLAGLKRVATQPTHLAGLVLGATCVTGLYIVAFDFSLRAVGADASFSEAALVYLGGVVVANVVPVPGGLGVMEAALTAGLTALGVPAATALAGVLCFRIATFWLPILPGVLAFRHMRHTHLL
ncbi:MAG: lysylphosphatidylglycerol synthase domain-containing protein [Acidimicrobiales bacterium]